MLVTRQRFVTDGIGGQFRVWHVVVRPFGSPDDRVSQPDLLDGALGAANVDVVSEPKRLDERYENARYEVRESRLGGEADDEGDDRRRSKDGPRHGLNLRNDQKRREDPDRDDHRFRTAANDAIAREGLRSLGQASRQRAIDDLRGHECREDDTARDRQPPEPLRFHVPKFSGAAGPSSPAPARVLNTAG